MGRGEDLVELGGLSGRLIARVGKRERHTAMEIKNDSVRESTEWGMNREFH